MATAADELTLRKPESAHEPTVRLARHDLEYDLDALFMDVSIRLTTKEKVLLFTMHGLTFGGRIRTLELSLNQSCSSTLGQAR